MSIVDGFFNDIGPTCPSGATLSYSLLPTPQASQETAGAKSRSGKRMSEPLLNGVATLSPEDSLASRYLLPAGVRLNVIRAGSGRISLESFAYYDHATSSWKTYQACLFRDQEWETYSESFPKWGIAKSGRLYRRQPLVRPTSEKGFSLLPTPAASEVSNNTKLMCSGDGRAKPNKLGWIAAMLLPTATATAHKRGYSNQAERGLLCPSHAGGPINPAWIEHLQGFPIGWTELEGSAMPSCQPSQNSSGGE